MMPLLAAFQFLTTIPLRIRANFSDAQLGASVAWYPIVGGVLGLVLFGAATLVQSIFSPFIAAALVLLGWVLLTGGLHLDGLMDACDGLFSHREAAERLRIMRDSHVGAWGVIGGASLVLLKFAALATLLQLPQARVAGALLLAPILARWALTFCIMAFPYGRPDGWGRVLKAHARRRHLAFATVVAFSAAVWLAGLLGIASLVAVCLVSLAVARFALDRLPGLTGDVYGAIAEMSEVAVLLLFTQKVF